MKLIQITGAAAAAALVASLALAADKGPSKDDAAVSSAIRGSVTGSIVFDGKKKEVKPLAKRSSRSTAVSSWGRRRRPASSTAGMHILDAVASTFFNGGDFRLRAYQYIFFRAWTLRLLPS